MWKFCRNMNTHYFGFMMKCMRLEMNCTLNNRCSSVACLKFRWYSFILKLWKSKSVKINFLIFDTYLFIYDKQKYRYDNSFNSTAPQIVSDFKKCVTPDIVHFEKECMICNIIEEIRRNKMIWTFIKYKLKYFHNY